MEEEKKAAKSDQILQSLIANQEIDGELYSSDEDFDLPFNEDHELDEFDDEDIKKQIIEAKNFFHEITGNIGKEEADSDDAEGEMTDADIVQIIPSNLEINSKMRDHILCLKQTLILKEKALKDKINQLLLEESESVVNRTPAEEDTDAVIVEGNTFNNSSKENYVIFHGHIGSFFNQFQAPYFKDKDNFPCPPNAHTLKLKSLNMRVLDLVPGKPWHSSSLEWLEKTLKKCLIEDYKNLPNFNSIFRWKEFSDYVKSHTIGDVLKNRDYKFDWLKVAAMLPDCEKRSDTECERMWNLYLCPKFTKTAWTESEDEKLLELSEKYREQHWDKIAQELGTSRSPYHTFIHYMKALRPNKYHGMRWTQAEDETLKNVVSKCKYGDYIAWRKVIYYFEDRVYAQLYNRYYNSIAVQKKGKFSLEEDKALITAVLKHGLDYRDAKRLLGNKRSCHQIRSRVENVRKVIEPKMKYGQFTEKEDRDLLRLVELKGPNFSEISKELGNRDRTQLRHRYNKLKMGFPQDRKLRGIKKNSSKKNKQLLSFYKEVKKQQLKNKTSFRQKQKWYGEVQKSLLNEGYGEGVSDIDLSTDPLVKYLNHAGSNIWPKYPHTFDYLGIDLSTDVCNILDSEFHYSDTDFEEILNDENYESIYGLLEHFKSLNVFSSEAGSQGSINDESNTTPVPGSSHGKSSTPSEQRATYTSPNVSDSLPSTSQGSFSSTIPIIPPSPPTMKGFLNLLSFCCEEQKSKDQSQAGASMSNLSTAEMRWKKRLLQLFLWSAIASKENPSLDLSVYSSKFPPS